MNDSPSPKDPAQCPLPKKRLVREISGVFLLQFLLVVGLVQLDRIFSLGGNLHVLVAVTFLMLPIWILDRSDRPYGRYGITFQSPTKDLIWTLVAMAILFPLVVLATHVGFAVLGPEMWGLRSVRPWAFSWPAHYPVQAISHFVVVALPEEFFYRGYLLGRLNDIFPRNFRLFGAKVGAGLVISAVAFGAVHALVDLDPARFLVFFPALAFGWLKEKRGSIVAPILFHAASNIFMEIFRAGYGLV